jgi:AraC-like DNA-binding protein
LNIRIYHPTYLLPDSQQEVYLSYYGRETCLPGHSCPGVRDHFLIVFVESGRGRYEANGFDIKLEAGSSFILFPHTFTIYEADTIHPWTYKWIGVTGMNSERILKDCGIRPDKPVLVHRNPDRLSRFYDEILDYEPHHARPDMLFKSGMLQVLLAEYGRDFDSEELGGEAEFLPDARIATSKQFMEEHYDKKITVATVADYVGLDRAYFSKLFKQATGISPYVYIMELRLQRAKTLLEQTDMPIEHIALLLGFNDMFHFGNFFKLKVGLSPLYYRKRLLQ